jgi:ABC-type nitrate/sulfonate/bicarbonate transport system substrate-binding protein
MRRLIPLLAVAALTGLLAGPSAAQSPAPAALVEVTYANLGPSSGAWPLFIAEHEGFFRDEGIKYVNVPFNNPQDVANAVASNATNLGDVQTDTSIDAVAHNLDIRIVTPTMLTVPYRLVVLPTITSWSQLKGVTVSLGSRNGSTILSYKRMLRAHHVDDNDFSIMVAGNSTLRLAALKSAQVQATMLAQPFDFLAVSQGMHVMADSSEVMGKDWVFSSMLINNTWGNANRATVVHFLRAYRRAIQFGYAHRDESIAILMPATHSDRDTAEKTYDLTFTKWKAFDPKLHMDPNALLTVGRALVDFGNITKVPAIGEMYDGSYAAAAAR